MFRKHRAVINTAVDEFIKSNKLNLNNDSDLIRVFEYINSQKTD
jgi:hypothetical protein